MVSSSTSYKTKLRGWFSYAFACEVFAVVSLTLFLPICLEQFARDNGYLLPDRTEPCSLFRPVSSANSTIPRSPEANEARCVVKIGWVWVDTASFSLYIYSISVAIQALTVISMGNIADKAKYRKRLLLGFATLGSLSATLFLFISSTSPFWLLSAFLALLANICFGASVVAMNAYLPALARESPEVVNILSEGSTHGDVIVPRDSDNFNDANARLEDSSEPLIARASPSIGPELRIKYDNELSRTTSRISSFGIALGYCAGITLLIVTLIPINILKGSTFSLRLAIGLSGIWWALFTIPAAFWLPGAHDTPAYATESWGNVVDTEEDWELLSEVAAAWVRLRDMLRWKEMKKLRNTFKYLAAWFLLSDGFTTITSTAILFGKTVLHMQASSLILVGALTSTSGIIGSLVWPFIQRRLKLTNLRVICILVIIASLLPAYGCLGFVFEGKGFGLTTPGEMFGLAILFGFSYGAFQGYARAFYAELLPPGEEARWYGLFSITDKSSSFLGPLIVGLISDATGNIRFGFFFLFFMIWSAMPLLYAIDIERGRKDAREYRLSD